MPPASSPSRVWLARLCLAALATCVSVDSLVGSGPALRWPRRISSAIRNTPQTAAPATAKPGRDQRIRGRIIRVSIVGLTLLAVLATLYGYLRLDHATRGFYSGRLQSLAVAMLVAVLILAWLAWSRWASG